MSSGDTHVQSMIHPNNSIEIAQDQPIQSNAFVDQSHHLEVEDHAQPTIHQTVAQRIFKINRSSQMTSWTMLNLWYPSSRASSTPDQFGQAQLAHCTCPTNSGWITWSYCNSVQATQPDSQVLSIDATMEPQVINTTSSNVVSLVEAINTHPMVTHSKSKANHSLLVATIDAVIEPITI